MKTVGYAAQSAEAPLAPIDFERLEQVDVRCRLVIDMTPMRPPA
jgi:hypothetical protein